jgi:hypothetical protein
MSIDLNNLAQSPLIPSNSNYDTSYTQTLKVNHLEAHSLYNGIISIGSGHISGVGLPTDPSDAITLEYIQGISPAGPSGAIQYNDHNIFGGSATLVYTGVSTIGTLSLNYGLHSGSSTSTGTFTDGFMTMNDTHISNVVTSPVGTNATTKKYVDFIMNRNNVSTISSNNDSTYTAANVLNGTIIRSLVNHHSDTLPTAQDMVNYISTYFGTDTINTMATAGIAYTCQIINEGTDYVNVLPNSSVTFDSNVGTSITIYPSYIASLTIVLTSVTTPAATVYLNSLNPGVVYVSSLFSSAGMNTTVPFAVNNNLLFPGPTTTTGSTSTAYKYLLSDVNKSIIIRKPTGDAIDTFDNIQFTGSFVIQNHSAFNITLSDTSSIGSWVFTPTGSYLIATGHSVMGLLNYDSTNNYFTVITDTSMSS